MPEELTVGQANAQLRSQARDAAFWMRRVASEIRDSDGSYILARHARRLEEAVEESTRALERMGVE